MVEEPSNCQIHGLALIRVVREATRVEEYNRQTRRYEASSRPVPKEFAQLEYLCELCDNI